MAPIRTRAVGAGSCKAETCHHSERRFSRDEWIIRVRAGRFLHLDCYEAGES
jgi:hypothetical protein